MKPIPKYRIIRQLGEGGMGNVFLAYSEDHQADVAIKLIKPEILVEHSILKRFQREIEVCKGLDHPFVIKILDSGLDKNQKAPYLVMEYLEGASLMDLIVDELLTPADCLRIFIQQCQALGYIHSKGILHRDIKPDNVFVLSEERSILLDFGLAFLDEATRLSRTSDTVGTLPLMSPEQLRGEKLTESSDIYNLGMTMYVALTRKIPYTGDDVVLLCRGEQKRRPRPPKVIDESIPEYLSTIVMKCIEPDRENRYKDAKSVEEDLLNKVVPSPAKKRPQSKKLLKKPDPDSSKGRVGPFQSTVQSKRPKLIAPLLILIFILSLASIVIFKKTSASGSIRPAQTPWDAVNSHADSALLVTSSLIEKHGPLALDYAKTPSSSIIDWFKTIDTMFASIETFSTKHPTLTHNLKTSSVKRQLLATLSKSPMKEYILAKDASVQRNRMKAARILRDLATNLTEKMYLSSAEHRLNNPVSTYLLQSIADELVQVQREDVSFDHINQIALWEKLWMKLPAEDAIGVNALFLRVRAFLLKMLVMRKTGASSFRVEVTEPALGYILGQSGSRRLSDTMVSYLRALIEANGFSLPAETRLVSPPHLTLANLNLKNKFVQVIDKSTPPEKDSAAINREFRKLHWLMLAHILAEPDPDVKRMVSVFSEIDYTEQSVIAIQRARGNSLGEQGISFINNNIPWELIERAREARIQRVKYLISRYEVKKSSWKEEKRITEEQKLLAWIYAAIHDTNKTDRKDHDEIWDYFSLAGPEGSFYCSFIRFSKLVLKKQLREAHKVILSALDTEAGKLENTTNLSQVVHTIYLTNLPIVMTAKLINRKWPSKYDLSLFKDFFPLISLLDEQLRTHGTAKNRELRNEFNTLSNLDRILSFCLWIYKFGATVDDVKLFKRSLINLKGDPLDIDELMEDVKKTSPPQRAGSYHWSPPKARGKAN